MENNNSIQQEKGKISLLQFCALTITSVISTADVFYPAFIAQEAKQDAWVSVIIGTIFSFIMVAVLLKLGLRYPNKTIIQYTQDILGKPLGKFVGFLYVLFFLEAAWFTTRQLGALYRTVFNPDAPMTVYNMLAVLVAAYAVYKGLEVIARVNEILFPFGFFILFFVTIFNIPNIDLSNYLPILAEGIVPPLRGSLLVAGVMAEVVVLLQLIPFTIEQKKIKKVIYLSTLILGVCLLGGTLIVTVFGPLTAIYLFPAFKLVQFIQIGEYFRNFEVMIMGVWIAGIFIKLTIFYYAAVLGMAQLFNFPTYKRMIIPFGTLIIVFSMGVVDSIAELVYGLHYIGPFVTIFYAFVLPGLLLCISMVRDKLKRKRPSEAAKQNDLAR